MGNSCVTVINYTNKRICVMSFNYTDASYSDYYNNNITVVSPGEFYNIQGGASTVGLQVAVISDVHPEEHYYSYDRWVCKLGATLEVNEVNSKLRVVTAQGKDCENNGREQKLYDAKRFTNLRMCLNVIRRNLGADTTTSPTSGESLPHCATAPYLIVDNSLNESPVKIMDIQDTLLSYLTVTRSIYDVVTSFSFHVFPSGKVDVYSYIKLPGNGQIIFPQDWEIPTTSHQVTSTSLKHLRLFSSNRYSFFTDPGIGKTTAIVTSLSAATEYMKIVPMHGVDSKGLSRLVIVLNILTSFFHVDTDRYLAVSSKSSLGRGNSSSPPPDISSDLAAWFRFCDTTSSGSITQEDIVRGLQCSFGKDLNDRTLENFASSVRAIWTQVFSNSDDFEVAAGSVALSQDDEIHKIKISLDVFTEPEGVGPTLVEYLAPIYQSLDFIFNQIKTVAAVSSDAAGRSILTLPGGCAITRQYVYDLLLAQHGDSEDTVMILQQMHPPLADLLSTLDSDPSAPPSLKRDPSHSSLSLPPSHDAYVSLEHPAVRVCALAARDIYTSTCGGLKDGTATVTTSLPLDCDQIEWRCISSGDVDIHRNQLTRWGLWQEVLPSGENKRDPFTVLAFRGTSLDKSFQDVLHDAMIQPLKLSLKYSSSSSNPAASTAGPFVYVHAGFYTAVENIFESILEALQSNHIEKFYVTGHSLGGALAQMFGLKYLVSHSLSLGIHPKANTILTNKLQHILTFAAPMILWYGDDAINVTAAEMLHPWRRKCLNYMFRADPVPLLPRMLSCKFCWNSLVACATSQSNWVGSYLAQKYIAIPEDGEIPDDSIFRTLKFTKGFVPPGLTVVLLGAGHRLGLDQQWKTSVVVPPESLRKLSTSFDTFMRPEDGFSLHSMSNYVSCCIHNAAYSEPAVSIEDVVIVD